MRALPLILLLMLGCTKSVYVPQIHTHIVTDTITRTQPDSTLIRALFECDSLGEVRISEIEQYKGASANQQVDFSSGEIRIETRWRTQYIDRVEMTTDTITVVREVEVVEREPYIPTIFWITFFFAILTVGYLLYLLVRRIRG
ncbi:MAG: hypothetical protein R3Y19_02875 [Rikenellaceae bacterium]